MSDYRKYSRVVKVKPGFHAYRMFLVLDCGHEIYRYQKTPPARVLCEYCNRSDWFPAEEQRATQMSLPQELDK